MLLQHASRWWLCVLLKCIDLHLWVCIACLRGSINVRLLLLLNIINIKLYKYQVIIIIKYYYFITRYVSLVSSCHSAGALVLYHILWVGSEGRGDLQGALSHADDHCRRIHGPFQSREVLSGQAHECSPVGDHWESSVSPFSSCLSPLPRSSPTLVSNPPTFLKPHFDHLIV